MITKHPQDPTTLLVRRPPQGEPRRATGPILAKQQGTRAGRGLGQGGTPTPCPILPPGSMGTTCDPPDQKTISVDRAWKQREQRKTSSVTLGLQTSGVDGEDPGLLQKMENGVHDWCGDEPMETGQQSKAELDRRADPCLYESP